MILAQRFTPLFIVSFFYGVTIAQFAQVGDSVGTIAFLFFVTWVFLTRLRFFTQLSVVPEVDLVMHQLAITLGVVGGLYLGGAESSVLWPLDATNTHLPLAKNVARAISGELRWADAGLHIPGASIHAVTGLMISIFGPSTTLTSLTLLLFKLATIVFIYRLGSCLFSPHVGYTAGLIYAFAPTVQFYTLNFYKEASVHLFVVSGFYFLYLLNVKQRLWAIIPLALALFLLMHERFYLVVLFIPSIVLLTVFSSKKYRGVKFILAITVLFFLVDNNIYLRKSPAWVFERLSQFRSAHMRFNDFSYDLNYEIPYILAVLKSLFTPYFTFKKLQTFLDLSNLLTWGSFFNQMIMLAASWSIWKSIKGDWKTHLAMILPFFILLLFLAYISPWSGRVRDSFYPIVSIYAAYFFCVRWRELSNQIKKRWFVSFGNR